MASRRDARGPSRPFYAPTFWEEPTHPPFWEQPPSPQLAPTPPPLVVAKPVRGGSDLLLFLNGEFLDVHVIPYPDSPGFGSLPRRVVDLRIGSMSVARVGSTPAGLVCSCDTFRSMSDCGHVATVAAAGLYPEVPALHRLGGEGGRL